MWICEAPSSTARRASAAYSSGVYGIAGHWSRFAIAPEIEHEMMTGSSNVLMLPPTPAVADAKRSGRGAVVPHTGMTPCLRQGRSTRLLRAIRRAAITRGRVSRGSITSSISALPAAM